MDELGYRVMVQLVLLPHKNIWKSPPLISYHGSAGHQQLLKLQQCKKIVYGHRLERKDNPTRYLLNPKKRFITYKYKVSTSQFFFFKVITRKAPANSFFVL